MMKNKTLIKKGISIYFLLISTSLLADYVATSNHPPYSINKEIVIGTYKGNSFSYNLAGADPDGEAVYFEIEDSTLLESAGVNCVIANANQLKCSISPSIAISSTSVCIENTFSSIEQCATVELYYHLIDERGMQSKKSYLINLMISISKTEIDDDSTAQTDIATNPRAFLNEMQEKSAATEYGVATSSSNPMNSFLNTDLFAPDTAFGKQMIYSKNGIESENVNSLSGEVIKYDTLAYDALGDSANTLDQGYLDDVVTNSVNALGQTVSSAPIYCTIDRTTIQNNSYFYCTLYGTSTKYQANNPDAAISAYKNCKSACVETSTCNTIEDEELVDFARDKNYLDEEDHSMRLLDSADTSTFNKIIVFTKDSSGALLDTRTSYTSSYILTNSLLWDDNIIPSTVSYDDDLKLRVSFMGDDKFKTYVSSNTYVIEPKISYWATIGGRDVLDSYDSSILYTIVLSSDKEKYTCPYPLVASEKYDDIDECNNICNIQYDCKYQAISSYGYDSIKNYCGDTQVSYGGVQLSLESAVEDGKCWLEEEVSIDWRGNEDIKYVTQQIPTTGYRPAIGFSEGDDAIQMEKAAEVSSAFTDMLVNGIDDLRYDKTEPIDDDLFKDFNGNQSDNLFDTQLVIGGEFGNFASYVLVKLNEAYFTRENLQIIDYDYLGATGSYALFDAYNQVLQRDPDLIGFNYWLNTINNIDNSITVDNIEESLFTSAIQSSENTVGIVICAVSVDISDITNERVSNQITFKILDNDGAFRIVAVGSPTPAFDTNNSNKMSVYKAFLSNHGTEPSTATLASLSASLSGSEPEDIDAAVRTAISDALTSLNKPLIDYYKDDTLITSIKNEMTTNFENAASGVFSANTLSFSVATNSVRDVKRDVINDKMYNDTILNYMRLKNQTNDESTLSFPVGLNKYAGAFTSVYAHSHQYLFAYVDKASNMKNLKVKDVMDIIYNDYKSGEKKYLVWNYKNRAEVVKKVTDKLVDYKDKDAINHLGRYVRVNTFTNYHSDAITTNYEDISNTKEDSVYIAKRGDNYIVKMNTSGENITYDGSACPEGVLYDPSIHKCVEALEEIVYNGEACSAGFTWNYNNDFEKQAEVFNEDGTSYFIDVPFTIDDLGVCVGENVYSYECKVELKRVAYSEDSCVVNCRDNTYMNTFSSCLAAVGTNGKCGDFEEDCSYQFSTSSFPSSLFGSERNLEFEEIRIKEDNSLLGYLDYISIHNTSTKDFVTSIEVSPSCLDGYLVDVQGHCYTGETTGIETEPACETADAAGNCYTVEGGTPIETATKNGYYFIYLQNKNNLSDIKFLTPLVDSSPTQCLKKAFRCDLTMQIYNSDKSCQNYCKTFNAGNVESGICSDMEVSETNLKTGNYALVEECDRNCYLEEAIPIQFIKLRLKVGNDIASTMGDMEITKYSTDGTVNTYNSVIRSNDLIYLAEDNSGIALQELNKDSSIVIKYSSVASDGKNTLGLGRDTLINSSENSSYEIAPLKVVSPDFNECANMAIYYPQMGIFVDIDVNSDGIYDTTIKISDTFVCYPLSPSLIEQRIEWDGTNINYDFIDYKGVVSRKSKLITIRNYGECVSDLEVINKIPLAQKYLTGEFVENAIPLSINIAGNNIPSYTKFSHKMFKSELGIISRDMSLYLGENNSNASFDAAELFEEVNNNKNIPIPFFEGVSFDDDFDVELGHTSVDTNNYSDYKMVAGYGYSPWRDCRTYEGEIETEDYEYVDKTNCVPYTSYTYDSDIRKCVGNKVLDEFSNLVCPYGIENVSGKCVISPICDTEYEEDVGDLAKCFKTIKTTTTGIKKICKPWWTLRRAYRCNGIDNLYVANAIINAGIPRNVNICTLKTTIYKTLAIDSEGNIVEVTAE